MHWISMKAATPKSIIFPAEKFPYGPVNVRIYAHNGKDRKDIFELQLFNLGGVVWNQGIPDHDPPAAKGLRLVYADDFDGPLSISNDGRGATYMAHKPGGGDFSGWPFSNVLGGKLSVRGVPYKKYNVYVYLGADADQGAGSVTISSPSGKVAPKGTYFYWKRWLDGLFVVSKATTLQEAEPSNCVVFEGNTAKEFNVTWTGNLKDGWTGVTGVQIVERR